MQYKPINGMDWVRAFYYLFMVQTGLADTYRNEQYFPKLEVFYNFERYLLALNFANPDQSKTARNLACYLNCSLKAAIEWLRSEDQEES